MALKSGRDATRTLQIHDRASLLLHLWSLESQHLMREISWAKTWPFFKGVAEGFRRSSLRPATLSDYLLRLLL